MSETSNAAEFAGAAPRGCGRAEEFVTYLYGEATPEESKVFRRHLAGCAVCREELSALGGVREAVGAWRAEALGTLPSLDFGGALAPAAVSTVKPERRRSASAALREFFSLAPLWLRAGAFAAALAVCALAALTFARAEIAIGENGVAFRTGVPERVIREQSPGQNLYTEEQVREIVTRNVAETEAMVRAERRQQQPEQIVNAAGDRDDKPQPQSASTHAPRRKRATRPAARRNDTLLAEDTEGNLPRLSDLLDGSYED
jgi:hypothetical protein